MLVRKKERERERERVCVVDVFSFFGFAVCSRDASLSYRFRSLLRWLNQQARTHHGITKIADGHETFPQKSEKEEAGEQDRFLIW